MSMTLDAFNELAAEVARLNDMDEDLAGSIVAAVGDTPDMDAEGKVVATVAGKEYHVAWPIEE